MDRVAPNCTACQERRVIGAKFCSACGAALLGDAAPTDSGYFPGQRRSGTASWPDLKMLGRYYGFLFLLVLISGWVRKISSNPKIGLWFIALWAIATVWGLRSEWGRVSRAFRFRVPKRAVLFNLIIVGAISVLFLRTYFWAFEAAGWSVIRVSDGYVTANWPKWSIYLMVAVLPGLYEEVAFRGILQTRLSAILSVKEAWLIQAALFSVLHLSPAIFISHFAMGLLLGWVRIRSGHIYFGMVLHAAWNAAVIWMELK